MDLLHRSFIFVGDVPSYLALFGAVAAILQEEERYRQGVQDSRQAQLRDGARRSIAEDRRGNVRFLFKGNRFLLSVREQLEQPAAWKLIISNMCKYRCLYTLHLLSNITKKQNTSYFHSNTFAGRVIALWALTKLEQLI